MRGRWMLAAVALAVVTALALIGCGGGEKGAATPIATSTTSIAPETPLRPTATPLSPRATPVPPTRTPGAAAALPPGWTRHTGDKFELGLPADWKAFAFSPETIDALIEQIGLTNPGFVPTLQAAKQQGVIKFAAFGPPLPSGFIPNVLVGYEALLLPLDDYLELMKKQVEPLGATIKAGETFNLRGDKAVRLDVRMKVSLPAGGSLSVEQQMIMVDHSGRRFSFNLTYLPEEAQKYKQLFDSVIQTFTIVE